VLPTIQDKRNFKAEGDDFDIIAIVDNISGRILDIRQILEPKEIVS